MILQALIGIWLILIPPQIQLNWNSPGQYDRLKITVSGYDEFRQQCVQSGMELRNRLELRWCKRRRFWLDNCADQRVEVRSLQFDPISETYRVRSDRIGDKSEPSVVSMDSKDEALARISIIEDLTLSYLTGGVVNQGTQGRNYLGVRLLSDCRGDYNETLARISYFLSFGAIKSTGYDSGWIDFDLTER